MLHVCVSLSLDVVGRWCGGAETRPYPSEKQQEHTEAEAPSWWGGPQGETRAEPHGPDQRQPPQHRPGPEPLRPQWGPKHSSERLEAPTPKQGWAKSTTTTATPPNMRVCACQVWVCRYFSVGGQTGHWHPNTCRFIWGVPAFLLTLVFMLIYYL